MSVQVAQQAAESSGSMELGLAVLAAGALAVPLFRKLGLGSVLGYLAAGLAVGPFGLNFVDKPEEMLHASELGVVLFLFIVGLEMKPSKLWQLRAQILGLGVLQVGLCSVFLTMVGIWLGFKPVIAFIAALGFVLTSTAIVMQILQEQGKLASPSGEKIVSILLLEDLAIVPILALVALLSPADSDGNLMTRLAAIAIAAGVVGAFLLFGGKILNAFFRVVVLSGAREVTTLAALVAVLGAAVLLEDSGLSMALGAFLAGVVLSTSNFRHQLETDITPFRDLLMGMFFIAVGMSLDVEIVAHHWHFLLLCVISFMVVKSLVIYLIARFLRSSRIEALQRATMMAQGGEFAFVLFTTATTSNLMDADTNAMLTAVVILSMALTPISIFGLERFLRWNKSLAAEASAVDETVPQVVVIGFGRFGHLVAQPFIGLNQRVMVIDRDENIVQQAEKFPQVTALQGDATDNKVLEAAGVRYARLVLVCTNDPAETTRIVSHIRQTYKELKVMARAFDEDHGLLLARAGVEHHVQELYESALAFGERAVHEFGLGAEKAEKFYEDFRKQDAHRMETQLMSGIQSSGDLLLASQDKPAAAPT
ncbi:MAG: cation:proton antiporter [Rhizobium sp.]|nr:cation:proton antiporter [Rhizobium sp.]